MHINYHANGGRGLCGGWLAVDLWLTRMSSSHLLLPEVFYHLDQMIWSFLFPVVFENVVFFSVFEMQKRMSYTVDKWFPDRASRSTCVFFPLQKYIFSKIIYSTVLLHKIYIWFKSVCLKIQCKRMAVHVHNCAYICMCTSALRSLINHHSAAIVSSMQMTRRAKHVRSVRTKLCICDIWRKMSIPKHIHLPWRNLFSWVEKFNVYIKKYA